ncbi:hypothetical protein [Wolbachia endosymbiont (group A) of Conops quadrifasciatus]|uniref:hypothetical protein n=1 Tax=Wolbachia endosymbiont (group A) of Conops quadrifasciatus TaxID=3066143 RepID=UPI0031330148
MSNYSVKESESNFELISGIGENDSRVIDDIEVKLSLNLLRAIKKRMHRSNMSTQF